MMPEDQTSTASHIPSNIVRDLAAFKAGAYEFALMQVANYTNPRNEGGGDTYLYGLATQALCHFGHLELKSEHDAKQLKLDEVPDAH